MNTLLKSAIVFALVFSVCSQFMGEAHAKPRHHAPRRFQCAELRGLPHLSKAYLDTLDACIWDFNHPNKNDIVR